MDERRSANRAEGPEDRQAAMAMGNSIRAWEDFYDRNYQKRECQAGVEVMASWRSQLLIKSNAEVCLPDTTQSRPVKRQRRRRSLVISSSESSDSDSESVCIIDDSDDD